MIDTEETSSIDTSQSPQKKNRKAMFVGIAVLVVATGLIVGLVFAAYNYLGVKGVSGSGAQITAVSVASTGLTGLDEWNIEGQKLTYEELEAKYLRLYNYTYPYLMKEAIKGEIIPAGVPEIYGEELGVAFDANTDKMTSILRKYEDRPLDEGQMERYTDVGLRISCEYCCGVKAIIFENGQRACGCAHSYAMRGLAKYLIINHPDNYTNDDILLELGKWKATFFPKQTISKAVLKYAELGNIDPSILTDLPNMVGSC